MVNCSTLFIRMSMCHQLKSFRSTKLWLLDFFQLNYTVIMTEVDLSHMSLVIHTRNDISIAILFIFVVTLCLFFHFAFNNYALRPTFVGSLFSVANQYTNTSHATIFDEYEGSMYNGHHNQTRSEIIERIEKCSIPCLHLIRSKS